MPDISGKHSSPSRQCKVCRKIRDKKELFRFAEIGGELCPSEGRTASGRGVYFCRCSGCVSSIFSDKKNVRNFLSRMSEDGIRKLKAFLDESGEPASLKNK